MTQTISIIIKAANQQTDDITVICEDTWTVETLKHHLSTIHPSHPKVDKQRLIYSGQLLNNASKLVNVMRADDQHKIVHLVCPSSPLISTLKAPISSENINDNVRRRFENNSQQQPQAPALQQQGHVVSSLSAIEQQALHQEYFLYLQQHYYCELWKQYYKSIGQSVNITNDSMSSLAANVCETRAQQPPVGQPPLAPVLPQEPLAAGAVAANAMGNDADADGGLALDDQAVTLADWLGIALRTFCVSLIMYYYSTMDKAVLSFVIFMFIMVIQAGYLDFVHGWFRRAVEAEVAADARVNQPQQANDGGNVPSAESAAPQVQEQNLMTSSTHVPTETLTSEQQSPAPEVTTDESSSSAQASNTQVHTVASRLIKLGVVLMRTIFTFVVTFFTSLVPERAPHLDAQ